jgi:hypothetical protein
VHKIGGARPGAGKPKGTLWSTTLEKHAARQFVTRNLEPLLQSQLDNALGLKHLMMRDPKSGKFERVTGDAKQIDKALSKGTAFWIYTKDPSIQAFTDLLNRAIDKPSEQVQIESSGPVVIRWMRPDETLEDNSKVLEIEAEHEE